MSPRQTINDIGDVETPAVLLPLPFSDSAENSNIHSGVSFCGPSAVALEPVTLADINAQVPEPHRKVQGTQDFELTFMPLDPGFTTFGALRVLLLDDRFVSKDGEADDEVQTKGRTAQVLKEWDVTGEVWVANE